MQDTLKFWKFVVFTNSLVPLVLLAWDWYHKRVGANPVEFVTRTTGMLTLIFLLLTLAATPLRKIFAINGLIRFRRMLGLFAFFYGSLHLITYIWFDRGFDLRSTVKDIAQRPFIAVGMAAFLLILPLAITSTNKMVKRLGGKRWARLHQAVYIAGIAAAIHYWMLVKSDTRLPLTVVFLLTLMLGYRLFLKFYPPNTEVTRRTIVPR